MPNNQLSNTNFLTITAGLTGVVGATQSFNQGLIIDNTGVIPASTRVMQFSGVAGMLTAGFASNSPAVVQAQAYFGQSPSPSFLWVGAQDATAIATIAIDTGQAGTGYTVGDIVALAHAGATGGTAKITAATSGVPTAVTLLTQGTGYTVANGLTTTGGTGTGLEINVLTVGETPLQALQACRNATSAWYTCFCSTAVDADHQAIAAWAEAQATPTWYTISTNEAAVLAGTTGNLALLLQSGTYNHTSIQYATTQGGLTPNNVYAPVAQSGEFLADTSASQTAAFKSLATIVPEPITQSQYTTLTGENVNVYAPFQAGNFFSPGIMCGGWYMDERIGVDILTADIQASVAAEFVVNPKIAQTNDGESIFINVINAACERAVTRGFIAPASQWNGVAIRVLNLQTGDPLPKGYLVGSASFTTQSVQDRSARKGMPITVVVGLAGAIQNLAITIDVQR